ncbi:hypothetical protein M899_1293 [Bacteriovorax sp. BSW11_IV]|nr:hypothetical protein M899_1293 [Bacteriovorax sp. BSW11_IV]
MLKFILIPLFTLFSQYSFSNEEKVECVLVDRVKCMCHAPLIVKCGLIEGHIEAQALSVNKKLPKLGSKIFLSIDSILYLGPNDRRPLGSLKSLIKKPQP